MPHPPRPPGVGHYVDWHYPDFGVESLPGNWFPEEYALWGELATEYPEIRGDFFAQTMFDQALFEYRSMDGEQRQRMRETLERYMADEYGLDFDDILDWELYREWYGLS